MKEKDHMTNSAGIEEAFNKNSIPFHDQTLNKIGTGGNYLNLMKAICEKAHSENHP